TPESGRQTVEILDWPSKEIRSVPKVVRQRKVLCMVGASSFVSPCSADVDCRTAGELAQPAITEQEGDAVQYTEAPDGPDDVSPRHWRRRRSTARLSCKIRRQRSSAVEGEVKVEPGQPRRSQSLAHYILPA
ncbi:7153_t:CDS:2, partial [Acaulospora colombiana]